MRNAIIYFKTKCCQIYFCEAKHGYRREQDRQEEDHAAQESGPLSQEGVVSSHCPAHFKSRHIGQTPVTKTAGLRVATDVINHRVYEVNLGDLNPGAEDLNGNTKFYLQTQLVSDGKCLTNFHGMDITRHKYGSLFRKGCDCIDVFMDIPTTDGYLLRVFVIAFTDRFRFQRRKNCHVKGRVIRMMRAGIYETLHNELGKVSIPVLVTKLSNFEVNAKLTEALQRSPCVAT